MEAAFLKIFVKELPKPAPSQTNIFHGAEFDGQRKQKCYKWRLLLLKILKQAQFPQKLDLQAALRSWGEAVGWQPEAEAIRQDAWAIRAMISFVALKKRNVKGGERTEPWLQELMAALTAAPTPRPSPSPEPSGSRSPRFLEKVRCVGDRAALGSQKKPKDVHAPKTIEEDILGLYGMKPGHSSSDSRLGSVKNPKRAPTIVENEVYALYGMKPPSSSSASSCVVEIEDDEDEVESLLCEETLPESESSMPMSVAATPAKAPEFHTYHDFGNLKLMRAFPNGSMEAAMMKPKTGHAFMFGFFLMATR